MLILKDVKLAECLLVSSHVRTLKHKAKHAYITQKQVFQLLHVHSIPMLSMLLLPSNGILIQLPLKCQAFSVNNLTTRLQQLIKSEARTSP